MNFNITHGLIGGLVGLWLQLMYYIYKLDKVTGEVNQKLYTLQGNHNLRVDDIVDLRKRLAKLEKGEKK